MKEHYRLTTLGECKPGDRVWFIAGMNDPLPLTVCWQKFKSFRATGVHIGHATNYDATKRNWNSETEVWKKAE